MRRSRILAAALAAALAASPLAAQAPTVSEKQDVAVFALGYYGWAIPLEALGSIDREIQKVFVDLGRFNILGYTERFSSGSLQDFISELKRAKEANFVMPEKFQFGEALFTDAEFNRLLGAFIVAVPVVTEFNSAYDRKSTKWETDIKTSVTFIDVSSGITIGIAQIDTYGSDETNQLESISDAIDGIPMQLQYEIRKIPAFQINTRVLTVSGSEIKLQLGQDMGIRKGDEYAVISGGMVEGFKDERETGLVQIKEVGAEVSTGQVLYSSAKLTKDVQLREIPRLGVDAEPYVHALTGMNTTILPGIRMPVSRGFYGVRPYAAVQVPLGQVWNAFTVFVVPVNVVVGAEYRAQLGRLAATPYAGVGLSYVYVSEAITGLSDETNYFPHVGGQAYLNLSYLVTRDIRIFADVGAEGWLNITRYDMFSSYGGLSFGAGVAFKL